MAMIAGIYSSIYSCKPVDRTAARVTAGKSGAARRNRKAAKAKAKRG